MRAGFFLLALFAAPHGALGGMYPCGESTYDMTYGGMQRQGTLFVPASLCTGLHSEDGSQPAETVPLVVVAHGFTSTPAAMLKKFRAASELYRVALLLPAGFGKSWNAEVCCGPALKNNVNDVGFIRAFTLQFLSASTQPDGDTSLAPGSADIPPERDETFKRVSPVVDGEDVKSNQVNVTFTRKLSYMTGHSNGGYMTSKMANYLFFDAVAPMSGHVYSLAPLPPQPIMLSWSSQDAVVRYGGCCNDPTKPKCCCGISEKANATCTSTPDIFKHWMSLNGCGSRRVSFSGHGNGARAIPSVSGQPNVSVECFTGVGCKFNTTLCTYAFVSPVTGIGNVHSFEDFTPVMDAYASTVRFFATKACTSGGLLYPETGVCHCRKGFKGIYCRDQKGRRGKNKGKRLGDKAVLAIVISGVLALCCIPVLIMRCRKEERSDLPRRIFEKVDDRDQADDFGLDSVAMSDAS